MTTQKINGSDEISIVVTAAPNVTATLSLCGDSEVLQSTTLHLGPDETVASFRLGVYSDTINSSLEGRLRFVVTVATDGAPLRAVVANVVTDFEVSDLVVEITSHRVPSLVASWFENRLFVNRCLRLWSVASPTAAPRVFLIPDVERNPGDKCTARWEIEREHPLLGGFLAEVKIDDPWEVSVRPAPQPTSTYVELGRKDAYLTRSELEDACEQGVQLVKRLWGQSRITPASSSDLNVAAEWLVTLTAIRREQSLDDGTVMELRELLFDEPDEGTRALLHACRGWDGDGNVLRLLEVLTLDDALTVPAKHLEPDEWDELGELLPVTWAAMDTARSSGRWQAVTGWHWHGGSYPAAGLPVHLSWLRWTVPDIGESVSRLRENPAGDERDSSKLLSWGRHQLGVFNWLRFQNPVDHEGTLAWQKRWSVLNDRTIQNLSKPTSSIFVTLAPKSGDTMGQRRVLNFPADVLAAALHVAAATRDKADAQRALLAATAIVPELTQRCALLAIVLAAAGRVVGALS